MSGKMYCPFMYYLPDKGKKGFIFSYRNFHQIYVLMYYTQVDTYEKSFHQICVLMYYTQLDTYEKSFHQIYVLRGRIHTHMATVNVNLTLIFKPTHPPPLTSAHGRNIVPFLSIPEYNLQYFNNAFLL